MGLIREEGLFEGGLYKKLIVKSLILHNSKGQSEFKHQSLSQSPSLSWVAYSRGGLIKEAHSRGEENCEVN